MTVVEDHAAGTACWIELFTSDPDAARRFYGELLGWEATEPDAEHGGYSNFLRDGHVVAGLMGNDGSQGAPDGWTTYFCAPDLAATVARAEAAGGRVDLPPMEAGPFGSMAFVTDPSGAALGLWQPASHRGFELYGDPGSVAWNELHTRDHAAAVPFYTQVLGWDARPMSDTDDFRYTVGNVGGGPAAGVLDAARVLPDGVPSHWVVYLAVDDADAAAAVVERLGGTVATAPHDTAFGRMADVADPGGIGFRLHQVGTFPEGG